MTDTTVDPTAERLGAYARIVDSAVEHDLSQRSNGAFDRAVADYPTRPSKRLRPALLLATCEAFGGSVDDALPAAVSIELMHSAFLVHDDIQDEATMRRGEETLHLRHGVPRSVHAGDALAVRAIDGLLDQPRISARVARRVAREFLDMADRTLAGQGMELEWRDDPARVVSLDDYLRLVLHKTCWYTTILPLRVGCILGSRGHASLTSLTSFGFLLGAAFQIRDDVLNLVGDPDEHGKDRHADIREAKRTLALIHLRRTATGRDHDRVERFLRLPTSDRSDADVAMVLELMHEHQSIDHAIGWCRAIGTAAAEGLDAAFDEAVDRASVEFIGGLAGYVTERVT